MGLRKEIKKYKSNRENFTTISIRKDYYDALRKLMISTSDKTGEQYNGVADFVLCSLNIKDVRSK